MARLSVGKIGFPRPRRDPALVAVDPDARSNFETASKVATEDRIRVRTLRCQARKLNNLVDAREVRRLNRKLARGKAPDSLASARYMRGLRRRLAGALWELVRRER